MGGTKRKPELLGHREQSVHRWVGPVVPGVVGHVEGHVGFSPQGSAKPWEEIFKQGIAWSNGRASETTRAVANALGDKETERGQLQTMSPSEMTVVRQKSQQRRGRWQTASCFRSRGRDG